MGKQGVKRHYPRKVALSRTILRTCARTHARRLQAFAQRINDYRPIEPRTPSPRTDTPPKPRTCSSAHRITPQTRTPSDHYPQREAAREGCEGEAPDRREEPERSEARSSPTRPKGGTRPKPGSSRLVLPLTYRIGSRLITSQTQVSTLNIRKERSTKPPNSTHTHPQHTSELLLRP